MGEHNVTANQPSNGTVDAAGGEAQGASSPASQSRRDAAGRTSADWIDRSEYPFESRFVDLTEGTVHYVDEGVGHPVVMLHGEPTWSFLYRDLIEGLSEEYRCIAPDYLGFGLSDRPDGWTYRPSDHARVIEEFLDELSLDQFTLVVHDWGGPIGMHYATLHPEEIHSIALANTVMWPVTGNWRARAFSAFARSRLGEYLDRERNVFVERVMPAAFGDRSRFTEEVHRHYREPLADPADRPGTRVFPAELIGSTEWLTELWERRDAIADAPALLFWGRRGPLFRTDDLRRWQALFPTARTVEFPDAGHFVHEEKGTAMLSELRRFLPE